jgi:hypothetical protein
MKEREKKEVGPINPWGGNEAYSRANSAHYML